MNKPVFIFEALEGATITASAGSASGYPTSNLQDRRYATQWKGGANTENQTLTFDLPSPREVDSVLISNHNLRQTEISALQLRCSLDNFASTDVLATTVSVFSEDPLFIECSLREFKYWRLVLVKSAALAVAPMIGMVFIGQKSELPIYLESPERGLQNDTEVEESLSGLKYASTTHEARQRWVIGFGALRNVSPDRIQLLDLFRLIKGTEGKRYPYWVRDFEGYWHFVRFTADYRPMIARGNVIFKMTGIEFEEERVGERMYLPGEAFAGEIDGGEGATVFGDEVDGGDGSTVFTDELDGGRKEFFV